MLHDKVAIVTGGGGGIGGGISTAFAREGARVAVVDISTEAAERTVAAIKDFGGSAVAVTCDIGISAEVDETVETVVDTFGTVDILVNNAQASNPGPFEDVSDADLQLAMNTGPLATAYFMRACFPHLKGGGRVINLRSGSEIPGMAGMATYVAAKGAISGMTKVAAREWGRHGITVNALAPAAQTKAAEAYFADNPDVLEELLATLSIPRLGDAEADAGRAAVFLAGPDSSYITGCTIAADGGGGFFG